MWFALSESKQVYFWTTVNRRHLGSHSSALLIPMVFQLLGGLLPDVHPSNPEKKAGTLVLYLIRKSVTQGGGTLLGWQFTHLVFTLSITVVILSSPDQKGVLYFVVKNGPTIPLCTAHCPTPMSKCETTSDGPTRLSTCKPEWPSEKRNRLTPLIEPANPPLNFIETREVRWG